MPHWIHWALAAVVSAAALFHAWQLRPAGRGRGRWDVDLTHTAMGLAMALMILTGLGGLPGRLCLAGFAVALLWFVGTALRGFVLQDAYAACQARQALCCAAMVGMLAVPQTGGNTGDGADDMPGMAGMAGMHQGSAGAAIVLVLVLGVLAVAWTGRVVLASAGRTRLHEGAQLATGLGSVAMLALML